MVNDPNSSTGGPVDPLLQGALDKLKTLVKNDEVCLPPLVQKSEFAANGLPLRHRKKIGELDYSGPWGVAVRKLMLRVGSGFLVTIIGARGSGKTQLATQVILEAAQRHRSTRYCTAVEFFMAIKETYGKEAKETESSVVREYASPSLLVIDEFGQRAETEWENRLLFELLNRRYNAMKDTILISNQDPAALNTALGPSLLSRMVETGGQITCDWPTFRHPTTTNYPDERDRPTDQAGGL